MKKLPILIVLSMMIAAQSCQKENSSTPSVNATIQQGTWKVTLFSEHGTDETIHYTDYEFQFDANGNISATKAGSTVNGNWTSGMDDDQQKIVFVFSITPFDELNSDWHIIEQTSTKISLEDVSGGNGGTDLLTFEKI